jgi:hypothetical protein
MLYPEKFFDILTIPLKPNGEKPPTKNVSRHKTSGQAPQKAQDRSDKNGIKTG